MKGRNPTAAEKRHMDAIRNLGCIVCSNLGYNTPPDFTCIHHIEGKTKPEAHYKVLPLCDRHHSRYHKTGLHYNKAKWQEEYGTEQELLEQCLELI